MLSDIFRCDFHFCTFYVECFYEYYDCSRLLRSFLFSRSKIYEFFNLAANGMTRKTMKNCSCPQQKKNTLLTNPTARRVVPARKLMCMSRPGLCLSYSRFLVVYVCVKLLITIVMCIVFSVSCSCFQLRQQCGARGVYLIFRFVCVMKIKTGKCFKIIRYAGF